MANLEFANAQLLRRLSMRSWDQDDPHELPGAHCFLPGAQPDGPGDVARRQPWPSSGHVNQDYAVYSVHLLIIKAPMLVREFSVIGALSSNR